MLFELLKSEISSFKKHQLKRNEIIYNEGDMPKSLFLIESGIVGLFHIAETGHETLLRIFSNHYVFGHRSLITQQEYHASSICLTPSVIYEISYAQFKEIYLKNPEVLFEVTKVLAKELKSSELRLSGLQDKSAHRRIVESIIYLKLKHPKYTWTRKEIAEFAGSTLESVVRVISSLQSEGLIEKIGRDFKICDYDKVLKYSSDL